MANEQDKKRNSGAACSRGSKVVETNKDATGRHSCAGTPAK